MSKSKAQKFAQKRNSSGGLLKGIVKNLNENIKDAATISEKKEVNKALSILGNVYNEWSDNYEQAKKEHV